MKNLSPKNEKLKRKAIRNSQKTEIETDEKKYLKNKKKHTCHLVKI